MPDMTWLAAVAQLREKREPGVLVTLAAVRGHAGAQSLWADSGD